MSVEQVKSSSTSANASTNASAGASHARGHGKSAAGASAGAGFTGLLDDFSAALTDGADASATSGGAGADGAGDLGALLAGGAGQARRKPGVKGGGDDTDALTAENGALPTDLVSQMALLAESARQAAAGATADAKSPANGEGAGAGLPGSLMAGADVTKATTDPAVLAQMAAAAQKDAGVAGASATGAGTVGDAGRVSLESGAMARKGHRDQLVQVQAQVGGGTEVGKAGLSTDAGTVGNLVPLAKADVDFKDMATRLMDNTPLTAAAEEAGKLLGRLTGAELSSSSEHKSVQAQDDRQSANLQPFSDGLDRSLNLGVSAATAGAAGGGLNDSNARSPEEVVAEQVSYWIHQKRQSAELTLDGGNGQPVAVSISMNGNEASVAFRSDQAVTRDMLNGALPELKTLLQGEGLILAGASVGAGSAQSDGSASSSRQDGGGTSGIRRIGSGGTASQADDTPATVVRRSVSTNRTLDLFV